ncbi:hypothetical protein JTB14_015353 [Gonioctena quinquepunctata]|nr:hypothetical protein JTB14_015353 [Gonioctena quinquepunctata]
MECTKCVTLSDITERHAKRKYQAHKFLSFYCFVQMHSYTMMSGTKVISLFKDHLARWLSAKQANSMKMLAGRHLTLLQNLDVVNFHDFNCMVLIDRSFSIGWNYHAGRVDLKTWKSFNPSAFRSSFIPSETFKAMGFS